MCFELVRQEYCNKKAYKMCKINLEYNTWLICVMKQTPSLSGFLDLSVSFLEKERVSRKLHLSNSSSSSRLLRRAAEQVARNLLE